MAFHEDRCTLVAVATPQQHTSERILAPAANLSDHFLFLDQTPPSREFLCSLAFPRSIPSLSTSYYNSIDPTGFGG